MLISRTSLRALSAVLVCGIALVGAQPSRAEDGQDSVSIATGGLDLSRPSGQSALKRRIEMAARRVCDQGSQASLVERSHYQDCHDQAVATASSQMLVLVTRATSGTAFASAGAGRGADAGLPSH